MDRMFPDGGWLGWVRRTLLAALQAWRHGGPPAAVIPPAVDDPEPGRMPELVWLRLYRGAEAGFTAGRMTEAQVLLLECLAELEEILEAMPLEGQDAYCRRHPEVAAALELQRRWNRRSSPSP